MSDYESTVKSLASAMGIDADEVSKRMRYLAFEEKDTKLLIELHEQMEGISREFIDKCQSFILSFPDTQLLIKDDVVASNLVESQVRYFKQLTSGDYGWDYVLNRLQVGLAHQHIGLKPQWYLGTFNAYLGYVFTQVCHHYAPDLNKAVETISALLKIIFFDLGLALEGYFYADQQAADKANSFASQIMNTVVDGIVVFDEHGVIETFNSAAEKIFCYPREDVVGKHISILVPDSTATEQGAFISKSADINRRMLPGDAPLNLEGRKKDGTGFSMEIFFSELNTESHKSYVGVIRDVSERKQELERLNIFARVVEQAAELIMITDPEASIIYVNPAFEAVTGYSKQELLGCSPRILKSGKHEDMFYKRLWEIISKGESFHDVIINKKKDGGVYYEERTITPILDERKNIVQYVSTGKDITEKMMYEEHTHYVSQHDALTGLPNRILLAERLNQALVRAERHNSFIALVVLDIDRFKTINDSMGHDAGDSLLMEVSERLVGNVREGDTVARVGGNEFAILFDDVAAIKDISPIVVKLLSNLQVPFVINEQDLFVTASVGISCYPEDGKDFNALLKNADVALHRAKDTGKNSYQFYSKDMGQKARQRMDLEKSLHRALENEEFILFYQPQYDIANDEIISVEALMRWQHPDRGIVSPIDFIPILEETGLIVELGEWTIAEVAKQYRNWQSLKLPIERISINISGRQFSKPTFIKTIKDVATEENISKSVFEVEITESSIMKNPEKAAHLLHTIKGMGIRIAMDDFGTGYSSLGYLQRFPIDTLKIDKSFINNVTHDKDSRSIISAVISLAQDLGLQVIAEGVETGHQLELLQDLGCNHIQGYLISKPLNGDKIAGFFKERHK